MINDRWISNKIKLILLIISIITFGLIGTSFILDMINSEIVELNEKEQLYNEEKSIEFSLTREKMLFGLFGDLKSKKIFITKKDGSTEIINVENDNIFFEKGNEWAIHKEVVQSVKKDGEIQSEHVNSYTIMGTEEKIVELAKDFTKTFQVEATFN